MSEHEKFYVAGFFSGLAEADANAPVLPDTAPVSADVRRWIDAYALLGAPVIRIFAGSPPKGVSRDEAIDRYVEAERQIYLNSDELAGKPEAAKEKIVAGMLADLHRAGFATDRLQQPVELSIDLRVEHALRPEEVAAALRPLLQPGSAERDRMLKDLTQVRQALGEPCPRPGSAARSAARHWRRWSRCGERRSMRRASPRIMSSGSR